MNKKRFLILAIITISIILINLILIVKIIPKSGIHRNVNNYKNENNSEITTLSKSESELEKLKNMKERERMEYYFSKFISYIKEEDYSKAYDLLYPEFKEKYFKTQEDFNNYVRKTYPKSVGFSYNDIQRQGYIYVLIIDIIDPTKKAGTEKSQRIVIQENDFNDFVLSFQVI